MIARLQLDSTVQYMDMICIKEASQISGVSQSTHRRQFERAGAAAPTRYQVSTRTIRYKRAEFTEWLTAKAEEQTPVLKDLPEHLRESRKRGPRRAA